MCTGCPPSLFSALPPFLPFRTPTFPPFPTLPSRSSLPSSRFPHPSPHVATHSRSSPPTQSRISPRPTYWAHRREVRRETSSPASPELCGFAPSSPPSPSNGMISYCRRRDAASKRRRRQLPQGRDGMGAHAQAVSAAAAAVVSPEAAADSSDSAAAPFLLRAFPRCHSVVVDPALLTNVAVHKTLAKRKREARGKMMKARPISSTRTTPTLGPQSQLSPSTPVAKAPSALFTSWVPSYHA